MSKIQGLLEGGLDGGVIVTSDVNCGIVGKENRRVRKK